MNGLTPRNRNFLQFEFWTDSNYNFQFEHLCTPNPISRRDWEYSPHKCTAYDMNWYAIKAYDDLVIEKNPTYGLYKSEMSVVMMIAPFVVICLANRSTVMFLNYALWWLDECTRCLGSVSLFSKSCLSFRSKVNYKTVVKEKKRIKYCIFKHQNIPPTISFWTQVQ